MYISAPGLILADFGSGGSEIDAMFFFIKEIYPKIVAKFPDCEVWMAGAQPLSSVIRLGEIAPLW